MYVPLLLHRCTATNEDRAYIIAVNATVLADSGATCKCRDPVDPKCMLQNEYTVEYNICLVGEWTHKSPCQVLV